MSHILITGGSGFIGREICRLAVANDYTVRSISRGGQPDTNERWVNAVEWQKADVFDPNSWRDLLDNCDAVIHTVGIISLTPTTGALRERLDGDSAIIAALEAERAGVPAFVLLSVIGSLAQEAHLAAKRRAEQTITTFDLRAAVLRLGPVYNNGIDSHYPRLLNAALKTIDEREWLGQCFGGARPSSVTRVAHAALQAAFDSETPDLLEINATRT